MVDTVLFSSKQQEWETPDSLFDPLNEEFHFTLDGAASPENYKVDKFCAIDGTYFVLNGKPVLFSDLDGLTYSYQSEVVWLNPPYGRTETIKWVRKAYEESRGTATVVVLLPSRTDTKWWHEYVLPHADEIRYIKGRIKFEGASGPAPFPSVLVIFRRKDEVSR